MIAHGFGMELLSSIPFLHFILIHSLFSICGQGVKRLSKIQGKTENSKRRYKTSGNFRKTACRNKTVCEAEKRAHSTMIRDEHIRAVIYFIYPPVFP